MCNASRFITWSRNAVEKGVQNSSRSPLRWEIRTNFGVGESADQPVGGGGSGVNWLRKITLLVGVRLLWSISLRFG